MSVNQIFFTIIFSLIAAIITVGILFFIRLRQQEGKMARALGMSLFLVSVPQKAKKQEGEKHNLKETIAVMEQLYNSLNNIRETKDTFFFGQPHLVFEIATPYIGEEIAFYIALPRKYETVIEKQIHGFFPSVEIKKVDDYNIFNPDGVTVGSYFKLAKSYALPIKTYQHLETDPLNEITNALSKIEEKGEGVSFQIIFKPTNDKWQSLSKSIARKMQDGKSFSKAYSETTASGLGQFIRDVTGQKSSGAKKQEEMVQKPIITPGQEEIIKAVEEKTNKTGFDVNLRLLVSATTKERAQELLNHLESAFVQFNAPNLNNLRLHKMHEGRSLKKLIFNFSFRLFNKNEKILLNSEELTSLFHFPTNLLETPKIKFLKSEVSSPPTNLPKEGIILGKNIYRGVESVVRLKDDDRRRHLYVVGQTGVGKSVFMRNLIIQDIRRGKGVAVLDPTGDIEKILEMIPEERVNDVIIFNPADLEKPLGINMLEYDPNHPEQKTFIVNEFIGIFDKLYDLKTTGGPMFEQYARNAMLLLMDDPADKYTIMEIPKVLSDRDFRLRLLKKCRNVIVKDFWEKEAEKAGGETALQNIVPYVTSKFNTFIANDYMRPIIGQSSSSFDFRKIIDEQKILLVDLSKGRLGDINSYLLGLIITGKLLAAALSRTDMPEEERKDFYLYIDEFQNFITDSIKTILSEARKYRLCLIVGHQFIGQLPEDIKSAVFGNIGSMVTFRVGAEDAEFLVKQYEPVFDSNDLINIDNFNAYIKLMIDSQISKPFNIATYSPEPGNVQIAQRIRQSSRNKYGRNRGEIETDIERRWMGKEEEEEATNSPVKEDEEIKKEEEPKEKNKESEKEDRSMLDALEEEDNDGSIF